MSTAKHRGLEDNLNRSNNKEYNEGRNWSSEHILVLVTAVVVTLLLVIVLLFLYKKCRKRNNRNECCDRRNGYTQGRQPYTNGFITTHGIPCGVHSPPAYDHDNYIPRNVIPTAAQNETQNDGDFTCNNSGLSGAQRQNQYLFRSMPVVNPAYSESLINSDNESITDDPLRDLYTETERSFTQTVCGKLLVSIARSIGHKGGVLYLDNMGISLHIPEGAVKRGDTKLVVLVLNWDLSDNPEMKKEQSLVSPVVYVGPHGLKLEKPCTLIFRHCAYNRNQIRVMRSETELTHQKTWKEVCNQGDNSGICYLTPDECQLNIETFTLYTCIQTPVEHMIGKKWLQIAVFACPLRNEINHHQVRLYFLNKTNCALQWAIQNEAKFGGKLICPEKVFLFDGNEHDMFTETKYMSDGWELVDPETSEKISFIKIWHGQCPYVSVCFRRSANQIATPTSLAIEMSLHVFTFQQTLTENGEKIFIQLFEDDNTPFSGKEIRCNHHIQIQINNIKDNNCETSRFDKTIQNRTVTGRQLALTGRNSPSNVSEQSLNRNAVMDSNNLKFVINNKFSSWSGSDYRSRMISEVTEPRLFPHTLRKRLVLLLDPPKCPFGQDWKDLASKLGMDTCIPKLQTLEHPTSVLLNVLENQGKSYSEVLSLFREIDRMDCVEEVRKYYETEKAKVNTNVREPSENTFEGNVRNESHLRSGVSMTTGSYVADNLSALFNNQSNSSATISKRTLYDST